MYFPFDSNIKQMSKYEATMAKNFKSWNPCFFIPTHCDTTLNNKQ